MRDPYQILGVSPDASDEEIKKAYRKLSRIYHPDANVNNPNKDQAEEKFKEVQQAYQQIMDHDTSSYQQQGGFGSYYQKAAGEDNQESSRLMAAQNYIQNGYFNEAKNVLDSITERDGRWYYLSAIVNTRLGNQATAVSHAQMAIQKEPNNLEYQRLLSQLQNGGVWYQTMGSPYGRTQMAGGDFCMKLCIANMACNICCGGGMCYGGGIYH